MLVSTAEGVAWGAAIGSAVPARAALAGGLIGGVIGLFGWALGPHGVDTARWPRANRCHQPTPGQITDHDGRTARVRSDGSTSQGSTPGSHHPPPSVHSPGPRASEVHSPRNDDDLAPGLDLPA